VPLRTAAIVQNESARLGTDSATCIGYGPAVRLRLVRVTLAIVILVGLAYVAIVVLPQWAAERVPGPDQATERGSVRTAVLATFAGLIALWGAIQATRTYELSRRGQFTDRFSKAVGQLGESDKLDLRLGGIYALERLAQESPHEHGSIVQILTAYIRSRAPVQRDSNPSSEQADTTDTRVPVDIQAVFSALVRRNPNHPEEVLDLTHSDLRAIRADGLQAVGARFKESLLCDAQMSGADLRRTDFTNADLSGISLVLADLRGAHLVQSTRLARANMDHADLRQAELRGPDLSSVENLATAKIELAKFTSPTQWPEGFDPLSRGAVKWDGT
jgi:hypothetical protein